MSYCVGVVLSIIQLFWIFCLFYLVCFSKKRSGYCDTPGVVICIVCIVLNFLILLHNPKNVHHFQMKLGTYVPRNSTHVFTKSHTLFNSPFYYFFLTINCTVNMYQRVSLLNSIENNNRFIHVLIEGIWSTGK